MIAHEVAKVIGDGQPDSLREVSAKFAGPVKPGDMLTVSLWKTGKVDTDGYEVLSWVSRVDGQAKPCLTEGRVHVRIHS